MDQVAAGLRTLHDADFTHGKLTPDRIRLLPSTDGHDVTVRVRGGGLVSLLGVPAAEPTRTGPTWCYLAPEQLETPLPTPLTDVYALGVLLYQLLTGRLPYVATSAQELTAAWRRPLAHLPKDAGAGPIPPALIELVAHCLMLQPEQRPLGVELVRAELRLALDVPPSRPPKSSKVDDVVAPPAAPAAPFERGSPPAVAPAAPFPQVAAIPKTEVHALSLEPLRRARQEHDAKPSLTSLLALCDTVNPPSPSVAGSRSLYAHGSGGVPAQTRTALAVTVAAVLFGTVFALLARLMTLRG
jgi:serine/threonine protein kinase